MASLLDGIGLMTYFEEYDARTGERSSFGGIAEAAAEYHARGEMCPWDCARCIGEWWDEPEELTEEEVDANAQWLADRAADEALREAESVAYAAQWGDTEPPF
jgi:hypothetical protein